MTKENGSKEANIAAMVDQRIASLIAIGVLAQAKKRRKGANWENKLAYEYVQHFYPNYPAWFRVSVGPIPGGQNDPLYYKLRRWADVIIRMPDHIEIIEVKMLAKPDVVGQLVNYGQLFPQTPMFEKYWNEPVKLKLVCSTIDGATKAFVESQGIEVEVYRGSNYEQWYNQVILKKEPE